MKEMKWFLVQFVQTIHGVLGRGFSFKKSWLEKLQNLGAILHPPPLNKTRNIPLCYLTILPVFLPCQLTTITHLFHLPSSLLSPLPLLPSSVHSQPSQLTILPMTNRSLQNSNVPPLGRQGKHM